MRRLLLLMAVTFFVLGGLGAQPVIAFQWTEVGDAGELPATAQMTVGLGALTQIDGVMGMENADQDVDMYGIRITDSSIFSATFSGSLTEDNDMQVYIFSTSGVLLFEDDDDGINRLPQISVGELSFLSAGEYLLGVNLFSTDPFDDPITAWDYMADHPQTGPYTIVLTGAAAAGNLSPVPEPATVALLGIGLVGLAGAEVRRRRKKKAVDKT